MADFNFDSLLEQQSERPQYTKEEYAEYKQKEREDFYKSIDVAARKVFGDGDTMKQYLNIQSHQPHMWVTNALSVFLHRPDATMVKTAREWENDGVYIKKGEHGFPILEKGGKYEKEDGTLGQSYDIRKGYDISQTKARQVPKQRLPNLQGRIMALLRASPVPIMPVQEEIQGGALYHPKDDKIYAQRGMDGADIFRRLSQEIAHAQLAKENPNYDRTESAFKAYCISYMLCKRNEIATSMYEFPPKMLELCRKKDARELKGELDAVQGAGSKITSRMNVAYKEMKRPQQKQEQPAR